MGKDMFGKSTQFKIILHNFTNLKPGDPEPVSKEVERVKGRGNAERRVNQLNETLTPEQRAAGWSHYLK